MKTTRALLWIGLGLCCGPHGVSAETAAERSILMQRQGAAALMRGKYDKAIQAYDQALDYDKLAPANRANILSDRGVASWRMNDKGKAIADFNEAIALNPQYAQVYNNMGNVLMDENRREEAITAFGKAIEFAPTYGVAYSNRASANFEGGSYEAAIGDFDAAIRYLAVSAVPHNGRGRTFLATNRPYAALRDFSRAIRLNGSYAMVYLSRARAYAGVGEYRDAIKDYNEAINIAQEEPQLYLERARAYQAASDYAPAVADFSKVIELAPGNAEAYAQRGVCYAFLRSFEKAFADVDKAVELDPTSAVGFLARAKVLKRKGDLDKAMIDLNTVIELDKENGEALKLIGQIHEIKNARDEAVAYYQRSLAADPFLDGSREGLKRLTGILPPYAATPIGEPVSGWKLARRSDGRYYVANDSYPYLHAALEMYGAGEPKLLEWVPGTGEFKGVGELRYQAGSRDDTGSSALVYAVIIDIKNAKMAAIEPVSWGDKVAKWRWVNGNAIVTDPDGMVSEVSLRKSSTRRSDEDELLNEAAPIGDVALPERRDAVRRPSVSERAGKPELGRKPQNNKSIFDWLFQ